MTTVNNTVTEKAFVIVGNVDAGKSSLIGTLISGKNDDGRGSARELVARHKHEIDSGKTSSISTKIIRFSNGSKATLIDVAGHQKYFKTTMYGISKQFPDYAIVVVSPTRGVLDMTKQHFKILMSYNIPIVIVVTRTDVTMRNSCQQTNKEINKLCKKYNITAEFMNGYDKYHSYVRGQKLKTNDNIDELTEQDKQDIAEYENFDKNKNEMINNIITGFNVVNGKQSYIPVLYISNVNGYCIDVLKNAMCNIAPRDIWTKNETNSNIVRFFMSKIGKTNDVINDQSGSIFYIDNIFNVKGVGMVISGINRGDDINVQTKLYIGPIDNEMIEFRIKSIHNDDRETVTCLKNHHRGCIAIKPVKEIKKESCMRNLIAISNKDKRKNVYRQFKAVITLFDDAKTTIKDGFEPMVYNGQIHQTAKVTIVEPADDNSIIVATFTFKYHVEYLDKNSVFLFRSGGFLNGIGYITNVIN